LGNSVERRFQHVAHFFFFRQRVCRGADTEGARSGVCGSAPSLGAQRSRWRGRPSLIRRPTGLSVLSASSAQRTRRPRPPRQPRWAAADRAPPSVRRPPDRARSQSGAAAVGRARHVPQIGPIVGRAKLHVNTSAIPHTLWPYGLQLPMETTCRTCNNGSGGIRLTPQTIPRRPVCSRGPVSHTRDIE